VLRERGLVAVTRADVEAALAHLGAPVSEHPLRGLLVERLRAAL